MRKLKIFNGQFYKLEPKNANCPHCKSTETFVSLYEESRYCNNCARTYNQSDEIRLAHKKEDEKLHMRVSVN